MTTAERAIALALRDGDLHDDCSWCDASLGRTLGASVEARLGREILIGQRRAESFGAGLVHRLGPTVNVVTDE